jgi:Sporulation and spore germination
MRRRIFALTTLSILAVVVAACGVPTDSKLENVRADDVFGLSATTSTTTTSTTTTSTTLPASTVPEMTSTTPAPTTEPPPITEEAKLYFILDDRLFIWATAVPPGAPRELILGKLLEGVPAIEATAALKTLVPPEAVVDFQNVDGTGRIELSQNFVETLPESPGEQALAFGQLVMTVLKGDTIGQVVFTYQGTGYAVVDGTGTTRGADELLTVADYANLLSE